MTTDPAPLKNLLGGKGKVLSRIKTAREGFAKMTVVKKAEYKQSQGVAIFKNWIHMDIWAYCLGNNIKFEDWFAEYERITDKQPDPEWFSNPKSIMLNDKGDIDSSVYDRAVTGDRCKICYNTGLAYLIKGIIFFNGKPDNLVLTTCWCRR